MILAKCAFQEVFLKFGGPTAVFLKLKLKFKSPQIIFRTSVEHPHHSLYVTLALSHASMDNSFPSSGHVTGGAVKSPRPSGRLAKKNSTAASTVDEV